MVGDVGIKPTLSRCKRNLLSLQQSPIWSYITESNCVILFCRQLPHHMAHVTLIELHWSGEQDSNLRFRNPKFRAIATRRPPVKIRFVEFCQLYCFYINDIYQMHMI